MQNRTISVQEQVLWTTSLYTVRNPVHHEIIAPLKAYIYAYEASRDERVASGVAANVKHGLFESTFDFFEAEDSAVDTLKQFCGAAVMEVVRHVNASSWRRDGNFSLVFHDSWFHITRRGGYHDVHNHPNCSWCGIYYLDIGDSNQKNGSNTFYDPRNAAHSYTDYGTEYLDGKTRFDTAPKNGNLVIFPSYLYHAAPPYDGEGDRIVVAFNAGIHYDP